jgi:hypothetical protein
MNYFPKNLIDYAKTKGVYIGLNDYQPFKDYSPAVSPPVIYLPEGNIAIEKLSSVAQKSNPELESWSIGAIVRHKSFNILSQDDGLADHFLAFLKTLSRLDMDDAYRIIGFTNDCNETIVTGQDYFYFLKEINFEVVNKTKK